MYNDDHVSCFKRLEVIGFKLGSSSKGDVPRRKRRILVPNSYFRDFEVNKCTARIHFSVNEKLAYECLMFYYVSPEHSKEVVINYGTFHELGSSLSRTDKVPVHSHVINALCRKLFKDRHPSVSRRHYFFSTAGDYLIRNEGNLNYHKNNCERCFRFANQCFSFMSSDLLFFPICHENHWFVFIVAIRDGYFVFLDSCFGENHYFQEKARSVIIPNFVKAWDEFIGYNYEFEDFVIHYAPVPKQDIEYWSKHDDGIFVMKYLELWDPYMNMMVQFQPSSINDIRVKYVSEMIFNKHNEMNSAKELISNFEAMNNIRMFANFQPASSLNF